MPSMRKIAEYWWTGDRAERAFGDKFHACYIGWGEPFCFACGWLAPVDDTQEPEKSWSDAAGWLERAHLVAHAQGGSDEAFNLVPLCHGCHRDMDLRAQVLSMQDATRFIKEREHCGHGRQLFSDWFHMEHGGDAQSALLDPILQTKGWHRVFHSYAEAVVRIRYGREIRPLSQKLIDADER